jgi:hypothetical protein
VSVGHIARLLEEAGTPTVVVGIKAFRPTMEVMSLPRVVVTSFLMGRTLGLPGERNQQRQVLLTALKLLESAEHGGSLIEI